MSTLAADEPIIADCISDDPLRSVADFVVILDGNDDDSDQQQQQPERGAGAVVTNTKIAFGSCHKNKYADTAIWKTVAAEHADAFLWTGDAIYPPVRNIANIDQLQLEYDRMLQNDVPGYFDFLTQRHIPVFGTWDDHDYGGNDLGADMPDKEARADLYWRFLNRTAPQDSNGNKRKGIYYSVLLRPSDSNQSNRSVKIIFLDTRWHRRPHCIPSVAGKFPLGAGIACLTRWISAGLFPTYCSKSYQPHAVLGAEQWGWLEREIESAPAVLLIVSSIQVLTTNPVMESWGQFPTERERLIRLLLHAGNRGSAVTVLSGDVHHGEILDPFPSQPHHNSFVEVTSSGLTHDCSKHIYGAMCQPLLEMFNGHRFRTSDKGSKNYYIGRNYGTVNIDWEAATVEVQVHNVTSGAAVLTTGARPLRTTYNNVWTENDVHSVLPCMNGHLVPVVSTALLALLFAVVGNKMRSARRYKV